MALFWNRWSHAKGFVLPRRGGVEPESCRARRRTPPHAADDFFTLPRRAIGGGERRVLAQPEVDIREV